MSGSQSPSSSSKGRLAASGSGAAMTRPARLTSRVARRIHRVDDVYVVRPRFGEVLPGMGARIEADERVLPTVRRAAPIVRLQRRRIVGALVAEQRAEIFDQLGVLDEPIPVVMADLVPQMAEHRAVRLVEPLTHRFAVRVVGFHDVHRQLALVVADHHGVLRRRVDGSRVDALVREQPEAQAVLVGRGPSGNRSVSSV